MPRRKIHLEQGKIYHILSKSIAGFKIFRNNSEYMRMKSLLNYYNSTMIPTKFSVFFRQKNKEQMFNEYLKKNEKLLEIISYCFMPTHIHLILKGLKDNAISVFLKNILSSYSLYFNAKTKRKGPLWQSRFDNILVETDEQLIHLSRYIHLNPVTAYLVDKPEDWDFSSYREFLGEIKENKKICNYSDFLETTPEEYKNFVNSQIDYQRELAEIKRLWLE